MQANELIMPSKYFPAQSIQSDPAIHKKQPLMQQQNTESQQNFNTQFFSLTVSASATLNLLCIDQLLQSLQYIQKLMNSQQIIEKLDEIQRTAITTARHKNFRDYFLAGKIFFSQQEQSNSMAMLLQLFLLSLTALHTFFTGLALQQPGSNPLDILHEVMQAQTHLYRILYSVMVSLKIFLILSFYLENIQHRYIAGLSWISRQIFSSFSLFKEIDLALTAFLSLLSWEENVAFMIVSLIMTMFYGTYMQNYVVRKSLNYATSYYDYLMLRSIVWVSYSANIVFLQVGNKQVFYYFCTGSAGFVLIWFIRSGNRFYYHTNISRMLSAVVALMLTTHIKFTENLVLGQQTDLLTEICRLILIFLCLVLFFWYCLQCKWSGLQKKQVSSVKQLDISLSKLLQMSLVSVEYEAELVGLLTLPQSNYQDEDSFYDPCLQCQIDSKDTVIQKQSLLRRYIKRSYLSRIDSEDIPTRNKNLIDYCEFLCNYDHNYIQAHRIISIVKGQSLHILDRNKIHHMKVLLEASSFKLGRMLYDGNLELEKVINCEANFTEIQKNTKKYIKSCIGIWTMLQYHDVSLLQFRYLLKTTFMSIKLISEGWKKISNFLPINRRWSFIYEQYRYFIKNERVKYQKNLFFNTQQNENINNSKHFNFSELTKQEELYSSELIFNDDSFFLRASLEQEDLVIKAASKRFASITGYNFAQVSGSSVSVLMSSELKEFHLQKFSSWMHKGLVSNENAYDIKTTELIIKSKASLVVYKYFKVIYSIQTGLQFFCMLKVNQPVLKVQDQSLLMPSAAQLSFKTINNSKKSIKNIQKNIFMKQELLQPLPTLKLIRYFKISSRIFLLLIILSIIILIIVSNNNSHKLNDYSNQFINFMNMYRFPVVLATNIMKNFLKVGNQTKIAAQVKTATNAFISNSQSELTKITLFDPILNPPQIYYPQYNYSFLVNQSQSQIDLFYLIASNIASLGLQLPVNRTGPGFQSFNSYLKPAYDNMMNTTKYRLHSQFSTIFSSCISNQQLLIYIQIGLFFLFLLIMFLCVHLFILKMKNILFIILDLNPCHIKTACQYWKNVQEHFRGLFQSDNLQQNDGIMSKYDIMKMEKTSLNKRSKQIIEDRQRSCFELKLRVSIIIAMVLILAISLSIQVLTIVKLKQLTAFQQAGFFFLKFFPCGPLVTMGCTEKYYFDLYPNQLHFRPQKYDDALGAMYTFGNLNNYIGQVEDSNSNYFNKQKNYFFGNPCAYNPAILNSVGITVAKCESMSNGTFKEGLSAFLRYGQRLGQNCIYNRVNLTAAQLDEFTLSGTVLSAYVLDAITTWASEFASKVLNLQYNNQIHCFLIILCIVAIHIMVNELRTLSIINEEYSFISRAYESLMAESVLVGEKVVRQKFIIEGIISS